MVNRNSVRHALKALHPTSRTHPSQVRNTCCVGGLRRVLDGVLMLGQQHLRPYRGRNVQAARRLGTKAPALSPYPRAANPQA